MTKLCKVVEKICNSDQVKSVLILGDVDKDAEVIGVASSKYVSVFSEEYPNHEVFDLVVLCDQCLLTDAVRFASTAKFVVIDESSGSGKLKSRRTGDVHLFLSSKNSVYLDRTNPCICVYSTFDVLDLQEFDYEEQQTTSTSADPRVVFPENETTTTETETTAS
jgi:hypothetical protein